MPTRAESAVLGAMIQDSHKAAEIVGMLVEQDFSDQESAWAFRAISEIVDERKPVDVIVVGEKLEKLMPNSMEFLFEISANCPGSANVIHYARLVIDESKRRQLKNYSEKVYRLADDAESAEKALDESLGMLTAMDSNDHGVEAREFKDLVADVKQAMESSMERKDGEVDGFESGLTLLDKRVNGFKPGDLVILAGRPGMGKTAYGCWLALKNALKSKRGLFFSVEMPDFQLTQRMISNVGRIPIKQVKDGIDENTGTSWNDLTTAVHRLKSADIPIIDKGGLHIRELVSIARKFHRRKPLDFVMVDHIHIMRAEGQSREREIADITGRLKELAKELGCPVIALAQLNRSVETRNDKRPQLSDLRDSGSIEQDADIIQFLFRPEYYWPDEPKHQGLTEVITAKFRSGEVGSDWIQCDLSRMSYSDLASAYN